MSKTTIKNLAYWSSIIGYTNLIVIIYLAPYFLKNKNERSSHNIILLIAMITLALLSDIAWHMVN